MSSRQRIGHEHRAENLLQADEVVGEAARRLEELDAVGEHVDYVTVVPDGEPTLDANLGRLVEGLRALGARVAVLSNGSLLWREDVRRDLQEADLVSVKPDAAREETWRRVNRPHPRLRLDTVIQGIRVFSEEYRGHTHLGDNACQRHSLRRRAGGDSGDPGLAPAPR
ncbi:radical SAM protein [Pyrodictium abyssi]|uniref:Radical SAM core domain-containing protein n=1 Tax=Pyrodictium abyssi TaxID=54256 RepID=A0ABN6ZJQ5_9CREN|nr:hypothetical protein PABY_00570 [Pyrodictium abyssi]